MCAVAVDPPDKLKETKAKAKATMAFVQDSEGALMDRFGIRDTGAHPFEERDIPRPAHVLIGADGNVLAIERVENYRVRPEPTAILSALQTRE